MSVYNQEYPGEFGMRLHDARDDLHRWFDNYKRDKYAYLSAHEWLTLEEVEWRHRGKRVVSYKGTIGADHHTNKREVLFEVGAPPPPTFFVPVKVKYEPPPPEPPGAAERRARYLAVHDYMMRQMLWGSLSTQQRFIANVLPPVKPPSPRYRRS